MQHNISMQTVSWGYSCHRKWVTWT